MITIVNHYLNSLSKPVINYFTENGEVQTNSEKEQYKNTHFCPFSTKQWNTGLYLQSSMFTLNTKFFLGLVSSMITAAIGYAIRWIVLVYFDYDMLINIDNWTVSMAYFCSLGGIRYVIREYLQENNFFMYNGSGSNPIGTNNGTGSNPIGTNNGNTSYFPVTNNGTGYFPVTNNGTGYFPVANNGGTNYFPVANNGGTNTGGNDPFTSTVSFPGPDVGIVAYINGSVIGTFKDNVTLKVYTPIDSGQLHGPDGSRYLSNWLTEVRTIFYDAIEAGHEFTHTQPKLDHVGTVKHADDARIKELILRANPGMASTRMSQKVITEKIIDSL